MSEAGHNSSGAVDANHLRAFIERVEVLNTEIKDRNEDKAAVFAEVKSAGYDAKIVKEIVKIRAQDRDARHEHETILDLYLNALGMS
jgi:uncharacterized protein (UPF0335 family)